MKRWLIYSLVAAFVFGLSTVTNATVILGEQTQMSGRSARNSAEHTFKWSHALKYSGEHEVEPFKFYHYFGSSQDNQGGQKSQNGQEDAFKWSHSHAFKGTLEGALQFSFGPPEDNQGSHQSRNGLVHAFDWSHSFTLSGDQEAEPFELHYYFGSSEDDSGIYKSMNGPEYAKWHSEVKDIMRQFYYYESCGAGNEPGYIPPESPHAVPEPVSILLMGLGGLWMVIQRKA